MALQLHKEAAPCCAHNEEILPTNKRKQQSQHAECNYGTKECHCKSLNSNMLLCLASRCRWFSSDEAILPTESKSSKKFGSFSLDFCFPLSKVSLGFSDDAPKMKEDVKQSVWLVRSQSDHV